jgi:hypothetical protein
MMIFSGDEAGFGEKGPWEARLSIDIEGGLGSRALTGAGRRTGRSIDTGFSTSATEGQPVVFSEKSPLHAVFAGQQGSTEVLREQ